MANTIDIAFQSRSVSRLQRLFAERDELLTKYYGADREECVLIGNRMSDVYGLIVQEVAANFSARGLISE